MRIWPTRLLGRRRDKVFSPGHHRWAGFSAIWTYASLVIGVAAAFALVVLSAACSAAPTSQKSNGVLWSAGFETGNLSEWTQGGGGGPEDSGTGSVTVSTDVAHSGRYSGKLTITGATNQTQGARLFRWAESITTPKAYYSAWFYFPQNYTGMIWWNVFQFKSKLSNTNNDPLWILNVGNRADGTMYFYLYDWIDRRSYTQHIANIPVGKWIQVEAYYQQATDHTGRITFWQDGTMLFDLNGIVTRRPGDEIDWSVDNYTDNITPSTATIYVDDAAISTKWLAPGDTGSSGQAQPAPASPQQPPQFMLGFKTLAELLGKIVGQPVDNERFNPANGDSVQHTSTGLMVWRKSDNVAAFTNGYMTWVNGPYGLQVRLNSQRFPWENSS